MVKNEKKSVRVSLWAAQNRFLFSIIYYSKQCLFAFLCFVAAPGLCKIAHCLHFYRIILSAVMIKEGIGQSFRPFAQHRGRK